MIIDDKSRDQKLKYDINKEAAKISALSSKNIDKYEHITSEDILHSDQRRVIKQAKSTFFFFRKSFRKINKNDWGSSRKQIKAIEEHEKQLIESNDFIKNDFDTNR